MARCCSHVHSHCCTEAIDFNKLLLCKDMTLDTKIDVTRCIQKVMYDKYEGNHDNSTDVICCDVFASDNNDEKGRCLSECMAVMQLIDFSIDEKLEKIEKCRKKNPLFKCFKRCMKLLWSDEKSESINYAQECSVKWKMLPGKIYIGQEIK
ncbi:unnamed protein product [Thelazia callipaeda]|uniref:Uncharacterized protein n=1 Tax=Thelazia callipaeda TaxID=103827 RepID=A0A0N5D3F5_THECL|nr:unnamed protein product [Thelazia callipaeda]